MNNDKEIKIIKKELPETIQEFLINNLHITNSNIETQIKKTAQA